MAGIDRIENYVLYCVWDWGFVKSKSFFIIRAYLKKPNSIFESEIKIRGDLEGDQER
jgi:hypothetical protein